MSICTIYCLRRVDDMYKTMYIMGWDTASMKVKT